MALTREFKDTVVELCANPDYRKALLLEALEVYAEGDMPTGNLLLRDYLNGTASFPYAEKRLDKKEASLRRMLSAKGNPSITNFFQIFRLCCEREGIETIEGLVNSLAEPSQDSSPKALQA